MSKNEKKTETKTAEPEPEDLKIPMGAPKITLEDRVEALELTVKNLKKLVDGQRDREFPFGS
jgi:hypothetical protein